MKTLGHDVSKSLKGTAKKSGKQLLYEPVEILKETGDQITRNEKKMANFDSTEFYEKSDEQQNSQENENKDTNTQKENLELQRRRMLNGL